MRKRGNVVGVFVILLFISLFIFFLSSQNKLGPLGSFLEFVSSPLRLLGSNAKMKMLQNPQNIQLTDQQKLVKQDQLLKENQALKDQFATSIVKPPTLLQASVVGAPSFIPGFTEPETIIIDQGSTDGVKERMMVIVNNSGVGTIEKTTASHSSIALLTNKALSITARDIQTNALGVVKGKGNGELTIENIILTEKVEKGDTIVSKGDENIEGVGYPPGIILGKVTSVEKKSSNLFQSASIQSTISFAKLTTVFVIIKNQ